MAFEPATFGQKELNSVKQRFGIIGNAPSLNYALSVAMRVAPTDLSVLITGESGVGKEVFSKIIHNLSPRKHNSFIAVNCGAIPEGTIDSELFGHEKGAFTGATDTRKGYFETVNGGTIFLDEIGEMPVSTQARLLRVLETGEFIKVGSSKVQKTDVRVVAATNVDLLENVQQSKFREDLYYRLNTVPLFVPPLRERGEDIHLLFRKFTNDFADRYRTQPVRLSPEAVQLLNDYDWPGNVRELKNVAEQISVLAVDRAIGAEELMPFLPNQQSRLPAIYKSQAHGTPDMTEREIMYKLLFDMRKDLNDLKSFVLRMADVTNMPTESNDFRDDFGKEEPLDNQLDLIHDPDKNPIVISQPHSRYGDSASMDEEESLSIAEKERELIIKALKKHKGKRKDAALDLGISERTLYRKIKEYHIDE